MSSGGKRFGAGRPIGTTKQDGRKWQVNIRLNAQEIADAERIGQGNASKGIRTALAAYVTATDAVPASPHPTG